MKKMIVFIVVVACGYVYFTWKPATQSIIEGMKFGDTLSYEGHKFHTIWGERETVSGYVRRIDRHYDASIPIITYNLVFTTKDYNDPDIVKVRYKGSGNYFWSSKIMPKGTIIFYHTIPSSRSAQFQLDKLKQGESVDFEVRVSETSEIQGDNGAYVKLMHTNHKFILVEGVKKSIIN